MKLTEAALAFIDEMRFGRNLSPQTLRAYGNDLTQFLEFLGGYFEKKPEIITADEIGHRDIRAFLSSQAAKGTGKRSLGRKLSAIRSFFDYILRQGGCTGNPAKLLSTPRFGSRTPEFLSRSDTNVLLDTPFPDDPLGTRNRAILELMYATGIRVGELVSINMQDINYRSRVLRVTGKGNKQREVLFGSTAMEALRQYEEARRELTEKTPDETALFVNRYGGRLSSRSVARMLKQRLLEVGIAQGISPHALRHTFATHMLNNGADIRSLQELLGHASLSTTQRYTQVSVEELMRTYLECHPRAK